MLSSMQIFLALILFFILSVRSLNAQNIGVLDEKYAFRDLKFESAISENSNFSFLKTDENNRYSNLPKK